MGVFQSTTDNILDGEEESNRNEISEINQNLMNSIFTNNSILNVHEQNNIIGIKSTSVKKAKAYNNPFMIKKESIKLEKKHDNNNLLYLKFAYSNISDNSVIKIYQNASLVKEGKM